MAAKKSSFHVVCKLASTHPDREVRCDALQRLAKFADHPKIREFLCERAIQDRYWKARYYALKMLGKISQRSSTTKFIVGRVNEDSDSRVRTGAIEIAVEIWRGKNIDILIKWICFSPFPDVRIQALSAIIDKYGTSKNELNVLIDRAKNDSDPVVRSLAVEALVRDWRNDKDVFKFLKKKAKSDTDPDVRRLASRVAMPPIKIFLSYSHKDGKYATEIVDYVSEELSRDGVEIWWDKRLLTGEYWDHEIRENIRECQIGLILVSQPFLNSRYCQNVEIRSFLRKRRADGMIIFPIIVSACAWQDYDWLKETQALPPSGKNLRSHYRSSGKRAELYFRALSHLQQVAREIRQAEVS